MWSCIWCNSWMICIRLFDGLSTNWIEFYELQNFKQKFYRYLICERDTPYIVVWSTDIKAKNKCYKPLNIINSHNLSSNTSLLSTLLPYFMYHTLPPSTPHHHRLFYPTIINNPDVRIPHKQDCYRFQCCFSHRWF